MILKATPEMPEQA